MPFPIAAAIAAGASIISGLIAGHQSRKNAERTANANMKLAQYQYQQDEAMMNKANAYNSPSAQMARFASAGLNPHLALQGGSNAGNMQALTPKYQAPTVDYTSVKPLMDPGSVVASYQDMSLKQAQVDSIEANTANTQARTANEALKGALMGVTKAHKDFDLDTKEGLRPYQFTKAELDIQKQRQALQVGVSRLLNMSREAQIKALDIQAKQKGLTTIQLKNEQIRQNIIFTQFKNYFHSIGVKDSDSPIVKFFARMFDKSGLNLTEPGKVIENLKGKLDVHGRDLWGRTPDDPMYGLPPR